MILDVRIDCFDAPVGLLADIPGGAVAFAYADDYLGRGDAIALSLSLPLREAPFSDYATRAFFSNLLPENDQLQRVMEREGLDRDDLTGLLFHLGGDCAGAVSCLAQGADPVKVPGLLATDYDFLSAAEINDIADRLAHQRPLPDEARDPSPLAGVQRKIALVATPDGRYALPKEKLGAPTTHILKFPETRHAREADLEAAAARLADSCGFDVAIPEVVSFDGVKGILIPRFDRIFKSDGVITRIHQEDFAQALGLPARLKYQRRGSGPRVFTLAAAAGLLNQCASPAKARAAFLRATFFNLAIGNSDNHAKNHALLYRSAGAPDFAPLYDLLPIRIDNRYTDELAFDIGAAKRAEDLTIEDFAVLFHEFGFTSAAAARFAQNEIGPMLKRLDAVVDETAPDMKDLADLIGTQSRRIADILELDVNLSERDLFVTGAGGWAVS